MLYREALPFPDSFIFADFSFALGPFAVTFSSRQQILRENPFSNDSKPSEEVRKEKVKR